MKSAAIQSVLALLQEDSRISDYKINVTKKESYELFFVKGALETVRSTDTCDRKVTIYVDHDGFRGDAELLLYPSTTIEEMREKLDEAVCSARMMNNAPYTLPEAETGTFRLPGNLDDSPMSALAEQISDLVFSANRHADGSLNAVEVFLNRYTESVCNSRGLSKTQQRCAAMVEAIPTFNGSRESVELYEQYNFSALDAKALVSEIASKMDAVQARYEAVKPDFPMDCKVVLHQQELDELFGSIAYDLNYATVYSHGNLFSKGDTIQRSRSGDPITLTMKGQADGNVRSSAFDGDGLSLGEAVLVRDGVAEAYYGSNRFGQYLGEVPTGNLGCLCVEPGSFRGVEGEPYLEVLSMSGLQVDFFQDYIGGEVRLAYYHDADRVLPVTGISISGKLRDVLDHLHLSADCVTFDGYTGPASALLDGMKIF